MKKHSTNTTKQQEQEIIKGGNSEEFIQQSQQENSFIVDYENQINEWKNKYLRALADYQNLERRSWQEKEDIKKFASETTLRKFIPAIDSLERAVKHIQDEGLALSLREFYKVLEQCGVKRIETVGKQFDPHLMECVEVIQGDDGIVLEEIRSGYMFFDKVLRVAQVKVGKK
ncbi:MAG: nucleotide exchange factor GrpE [Patescibacteria group bacterium]|nr:nucleotide exchange factor GrpE [Patescibacteria group bacterium]